MSKNDQCGAGLIDIIIASSIFLMLFQFLMQSFINFQKFQKYESMQLSKLFLKNFINDSIDCKKTLEPLKPQCTEDDYVELLAYSGDKLVSIPEEDIYTKIGNYQVRAVCSSGGLEIDVEARLVNKNDEPVGNPLKPNKSKHELWDSVYKKISFMCVLE